MAILGHVGDDLDVHLATAEHRLDEGVGLRLGQCRPTLHRGRLTHGGHDRGADIGRQVHRDRDATGVVGDPTKTALADLLRVVPVRRSTTRGDQLRQLAGGEVPRHLTPPQLGVGGGHTCELADPSSTTGGRPRSPA